MLGGKYRVQSVLAFGGMGVVYAGRHEITGRSVAIKLLRAELATRPDLVRRVAAEARLAVEASHPNVVEVLDAGADDLGTPYLVLERLYGRPLEDLLAERLSLGTAARALVPVMNALGALHGAGIVHRDIKPSNIFLSREGERVTPKLLDFGIAKALSGGDATLSNVTLGTPSYMAPEQALGCATLGPATDVWSMGVVFVRCLTGRLPFEALPRRGPSALRSGLAAERLEHVPKSVGEVLVRALQLDPDDRFSSMAEFAGALLEGLRRVDSQQGWPGPGTVSYSMPEFTADDAALASQLAGTFQSDGAEADQRPARPLDVLTRTLSKVVPTTWGRGKRMAVGACSVLAVSGALGLAVWRAPDAPVSAAPETRAASTDALVNGPGPDDTVRTEQSVASIPPMDGNTESAALSSPSALVAPATSLERLRRQPASESVDVNPAALPRLREPAETALGPNRAPIIE